MTGEQVRTTGACTRRFTHVQQATRKQINTRPWMLAYGLEPNIYPAAQVRTSVDNDVTDLKIAH